MAAASDTTWLHEDFADELDPGNRLVFGIVREAKVGEPGSTAFFTIDCSDGVVIAEEFVYPTLNPCDAVGSWVKLELSPDNRVGARRFKLIEEMRAANAALSAAESARKKRREREEIERQALLGPLLEEVQRRRRAAGKGFFTAFGFDYEIQRLEKMSLKSLKKLQASRRGAEPGSMF